MPIKMMKQAAKIINNLIHIFTLREAIFLFFYKVKRIVSWGEWSLNKQWKLNSNQINLFYNKKFYDSSLFV